MKVCICLVFAAGMDGVTKTQLVESLMGILENSHVFAMATEVSITAYKYHSISPEIDSERFPY